jgi:hypothetical protein
MMQIFGKQIVPLILYSVQCTYHGPGCGGRWQWTDCPFNPVQCTVHTMVLAVVGGGSGQIVPLILYSVQYIPWSWLWWEVAVDRLSL